MCRSMDWTGVSILMNRWSCKSVARTGCDGQLPGGSRRLDRLDFSMTWVNRTMLLRISWNKLPTGSRKLRLKQLFSGLGDVVR